MVFAFFVVFAVPVLIGWFRSKKGKWYFRILFALLGLLVAALVYSIITEGFGIDEESALGNSIALLLIIVGSYYGVEFYIRRVSSSASQTPTQVQQPMAQSFTPEIKEAANINMETFTLSKEEIEQVRALMLEGEIDESLEKLLEIVMIHYVKSRSDVIGLNARYELIQKEYRAGIIDYQTKTRQENHLIAGILELLEELEKRTKKP